MDTATEIVYAYNGQGVISQTPLLPFTTGYDPKYRSEFGTYDPARAKALLDLYGYVDRDGDGWREMPDGSPLLLRISTQSDQRSRKISEVMDRNMRTLGIRVTSLVAQWPENLKAVRAGRLQMWSLGIWANGPDAVGVYQLYDSREIGGQNYARFKMPAVDKLYDELQLLPDGPRRAAAFREIEKLALAYMPYKFVLERRAVDMTQPQLIGFRRPIFWNEWWQFVDIDNSLRKAR